MSGTAATPFQFNLAPDWLWQPITLWSQGSQFGLINVSLGETKHPEVERAVLSEIGSYGRQLGHIGDALEVLMDQADQAALTPEQRDCLAILKGELAEIRKVKTRELAR